MRFMQFDWDAAKNRTNQRKHGVSFEEAVSVFYDDNAIQFFNSGQLEEDRFLMLGMSIKLRILLVCHCVRDGQTIRIISARKATAKERKFYTGGAS